MRGRLLVIAETAASVWSYHLREVEDGKLFLGGGAPPALCGEELGWDTRIPLKAWGKKNHWPETWCKDCETRAGAQTRPEERKERP